MTANERGKKHIGKLAGGRTKGTLSLAFENDVQLA